MGDVIKLRDFRRKDDQEAKSYFVNRPNAAFFIRGWRPEDEVSRLKADARRKQHGWMTIFFRNGEMTRIRFRRAERVDPKQVYLKDAVAEATILLRLSVHAAIKARPELAQDPC